MNKKGRRVAFYTLGCKVNQYETEALEALFKNRGYEIVDFTEEADVYVINTCTVTHLADRKSRQVIRRCLKTNPGAKIAVTGCYAQNAPEEAAGMPGVILVTGTVGRKNMVDWLEQYPGQDQEQNQEQDQERTKPLNRVAKVQTVSAFEEIETDRMIERSRPYLKVQEGCEQFCSYCTIPYVRGPLRSRPPDAALREAEKLVAAGFKEIVLTGIHLGAYGRDLGPGVTLEQLLRQLLELTEGVRWRLSSLEPVEVTPGILKLLKDYGNFCPHFHLPLQGGHDDILKAMNRPYTTARYRETADMIREVAPEVCLTTDIMVGFPGETEKHFAACLKFVEEMAFGGMHVFKYSPRKGTPAARLPGQVPPQVKEKRSRELIRLRDELAGRYAARFLGRELDVLAEVQLQEGFWEGHSANYLVVRFESHEVSRGQIIPVEVTATGGEASCGRVIISDR